MSLDGETGGKLKSQLSKKELKNKQRIEEEGHANLEYVPFIYAHC